jgi:hypothetical protein
LASLSVSTIQPATHDIGLVGWLQTDVESDRCPAVRVDSHRDPRSATLLKHVAVEDNIEWLVVKLPTLVRRIRVWLGHKIPPYYVGSARSHIDWIAFLLIITLIRPSP